MNTVHPNSQKAQKTESKVNLTYEALEYIFLSLIVHRQTDTAVIMKLLKVMTEVKAGHLRPSILTIAAVRLHVKSSLYAKKRQAAALEHTSY